jgi:hypothetical protein
MSTVTSLAQLVEVRNNVFQIDKNPYISEADQILLRSVLNINSRFSSVTRWDEIIIATRTQIENQTTPMVQSGDYISFRQPITQYTPQPSQDWTSVTTKLVTSFRSTPFRGLSDAGQNKLSNPDIPNGYLDVLKSLFTNICNSKYQSDSAFTSTYFDTLITDKIEKINVVININGEISVIPYDTYLILCQKAVVDIFAKLYRAEHLQLFLVVFRPWLIVMYLSKLIRNTQDTAKTNKPRTLYIQTVLSVVFRLYIIQTYLVLKQLIINNVGLDDLISLELTLLRQETGGNRETVNAVPTVFSELGNLLNVASETNTNIVAVGSVLEQQKINLEKALANDLSANSRLNNWMIVFWLVFTILVLILALGGATLYLSDNQDLKSTTIYICSTALIAIIIYWLVVAVKK